MAYKPNSYKITTARFSDKLCKVAENYGHTTVGSLHKALSKAKPSTRWYYDTTYVRGAMLLRELNFFRIIAS